MMHFCSVTRLLGMMLMKEEGKKIFYALLLHRNIKHKKTYREQKAHKKMRH
jgi:hypothetical protein